MSLVERARWGLLALMVGAAGCSTPCDALKQRAAACGQAEAHYVDERDSACRTARVELGAASFDDYAACVSTTPCGEEIDGCIDASFATSAQDPCVRYTLWAVGCGLEPVGIEDNCQGVTSTAGADGFATWVDCITVGGCPLPNDERFNTCQNLLPPGVSDLLDACQMVFEWTTKCEGGADGLLPVDVITVPECLAQAQPFRVSSYLEYATCQYALACDDVLGRLQCVLLLEITDRSQVTAQCEELLAFTATCGSNLGGESVPACEQIFARFTSESFDAYITCLASYACDDPQGALACAPLLVLD